MKTFLAVFTGNAAAMDAFRKLPEAQIAKTQAEGAKAWHAWVDKNKASLVQMGGPLGKTKKISKAVDSGDVDQLKKAMADAGQSVDDAITS